LMLDMAREQGTAFVMVTHDQELAARCEVRLALAQGAVQ
ncbi:MAG: lipoprotein-releasing system ATP-binding protein LolD, partial [Paucibacter sp.]|nr:lipoprotein-releasing system ATP-binding protein LolD [Roseateles sp.]